jgi:hypothetical protein
MPESDRTDAKLRYAALTLDELKDDLHRGKGGDFERAHEEAFMFHLFGARDAFLQELNIYYGCGLPLKDVSINGFQNWEKKTGKQMPELKDIIDLSNDSNSQLSAIKEWRHFSTHQAGVPRTFYVGGNEDGQRRFRDLKAGTLRTRDVVDEFESALAELEREIARLRASARKANGIP